MVTCIAQSAVFFQFQSSANWSFYAFNFARIVWFVCSISEKTQYSVSWLTFDTRYSAQGDPGPLVSHCSARLSQKNEKYTWQVWSTEGWVGILVASISSLRITRYSMGSWESPNYVRNSTPPTDQRGVELIFHSFPNPPLHPSLHQAARLSPPRPCAPSTSSLPHLPLIFRDIW